MYVYYTFMYFLWVSISIKYQPLRLKASTLTAPPKKKSNWVVFRKMFTLQNNSNASQHVDTEMINIFQGRGEVRALYKTMRTFPVTIYDPHHVSDSVAIDDVQ